MNESTQLTVFTRNITNTYGTTIDQDEVKNRMSSLILRLAALKDEIPPALILPPGVITTKGQSVSGGGSCGIYVGFFDKMKVAVKRYTRPLNSTQEGYFARRKVALLHNGV